jgi:hypothetical protein
MFTFGVNISIWGVSTILELFGDEPFKEVYFLKISMWKAP